MRDGSEGYERNYHLWCRPMSVQNSNHVYLPILILKKFWIFLCEGREGDMATSPTSESRSVFKKKLGNDE